VQVRITRGGPPSLEDPDDFRAFSVVVTGSTAAAERKGLSVLGPVADDLAHVFVETAWILDQVGPRSQSPEWREKFAAMTALAAQHGWVDADGRIRAHIVESA
jgi:hypothetical protein